MTHVTVTRTEAGLTETVAVITSRSHDVSELRNIVNSAVEASMRSGGQTATDRIKELEGKLLEADEARRKAVSELQDEGSALHEALTIIARDIGSKSPREAGPEEIVELISNLRAERDTALRANDDWVKRAELQADQIRGLNERIVKLTAQLEEERNGQQTEGHLHCLDCGLSEGFSSKEEREAAEKRMRAHDLVCSESPLVQNIKEAKEAYAGLVDATAKLNAEKDAANKTLRSELDGARGKVTELVLDRTTSLGWLEDLAKRYNTLAEKHGAPPVHMVPGEGYQERTNYEPEKAPEVKKSCGTCQYSQECDLPDADVDVERFAKCVQFSEWKPKVDEAATKAAVESGCDVVILGQDPPPTNPPAVPLEVVTKSCETCADNRACKDLPPLTAEVHFGKCRGSLDPTAKCAYLLWRPKPDAEPEIGPNRDGGVSLGENKFLSDEQKAAFEKRDPFRPEVLNQPAEPSGEDEDEEEVIDAEDCEPGYHAAPEGSTYERPHVDPPEPGQMRVG